MAIPIAKIQEGCCNSDLSQFTIIEGDALDSAGSTCDKVIECSDKYILVEEKSLLYGFFNLCFTELNIDLETYKYDSDGVIYLRITDVISLIQSLNIDAKERLLAEDVASLLSTSLKKVSNMTHILATQFNSAKTANMPIFYLYCNSGKPIDMIMSTWLSRDRKNVFIECTDLKKILQQKPC